MPGTQGHVQCVCPDTKHPEQVHAWERKQPGGYQGLGGRRLGSDYLRGTGFWGADEDLLEPERGGGCTTLNIPQATELFALKWLNFCYVSPQFLRKHSRQGAGDYKGREAGGVTGSGFLKAVVLGVGPVKAESVGKERWWPEPGGPLRSCSGL